MRQQSSGATSGSAIDELRFCARAEKCEAQMVTDLILK
jgi:hypothetical protein